MPNHNAAPQSTPPEEIWDPKAERLYDQGEINATQARELSGIGTLQHTAEVIPIEQAATSTPRPARSQSARARARNDVAAVAARKKPFPYGNEDLESYK